MDPNKRDLALLLISRSTRNFASGFIAVIIGLYYLYSLHLSLLKIGILFGVGAFAVPLIVLLLGSLGDKYGRKNILIITLLFTPIAIMILLYTTYYPLLLVSSALGGFGVAGGIVGGGVGASVAPMQTALIAEKTNSQNRTFFYTLFSIVSSLAGSAGALLSYMNNYDVLFYISLVFYMLSFVFVLPIKENFKSNKKKNVKNAISKKDKNMIKKFSITGVFNGLGQGLIIPFIPIIFSKHFHMTNGVIGEIFAIGGVITALAMIATPYLTERLGFLDFITGSRIVSSIFILVLAFSINPLMAIASYIIMTPSRAIALPSQQALMMNLVSEKSRSTASGANQSTRLFPSALATTFSGALLDEFPLYLPFTISFGISLVNVLLYRYFFGTIPEANKKGKVVIRE
jgi:MFS family permease